MGEDRCALGTVMPYHEVVERLRCSWLSAFDILLPVSVTKLPLCTLESFNGRRLLTQSIRTQQARACSFHQTHTGGQVLPALAFKKPQQEGDVIQQRPKRSELLANKECTCVLSFAMSVTQAAQSKQ